MPPPQAAPAQGNLFAAPFVALVEAARKPIFWVLAGAFFVCGASTNGLVQMHLIPMCGDYGIAAVSAVGLLALMGVFDFVGTIASGWLSDRYNSRILLFWYYGLRGLSLLYLPFSGFEAIPLTIFAVFYGLDWIATVPPIVKLTAEAFGPARANLVFGGSSRRTSSAPASPHSPPASYAPNSAPMRPPSRALDSSV